MREALVSKLPIVWLLLTALLFPAIGIAAPREINITSDSAPGWIPSAAQEEQVVQTTNNYFDAIDSEQYQRAYSMMNEMNRSAFTLQQFTRQNHTLHEQAGLLKQRKILKITWTKDPAAAAIPGIYAAVDIATHYANIDRHCGFVVLYQSPSSDNFEIMRQESNFITNATAEKIAHEQSPTALENSWKKLAENCPNI